MKDILYNYGWIIQLRIGFICSELFIGYWMIMFLNLTVVVVNGRMLSELFIHRGTGGPVV